MYLAIVSSEKMPANSSLSALAAWSTNRCVTGSRIWLIFRSLDIDDDRSPDSDEDIDLCQYAQR